MTREGITKAAGTYTVTDIIFRQPARLFGPPNKRASEEDIEAVRVGEARLVACFLKGPCDPYPLRRSRACSCFVANE